MPIEIRIKKINAQKFQMTFVYSSVGTTAIRITSDWKRYVADHGYGKVPRVWE